LPAIVSPDDWDVTLAPDYFALLMLALNGQIRAATTSPSQSINDGIGFAVLV
jgi:lipopolysaccharide assembly outer membrane protein LptD (OstA)